MTYQVQPPHIGSHISPWTQTLRTPRSVPTRTSHPTRADNWLPEKRVISAPQTARGDFYAHRLRANSEATSRASRFAQTASPVLEGQRSRSQARQARAWQGMPGLPPPWPRDAGHVDDGAYDNVTCAPYDAEAALTQVNAAGRIYRFVKARETEGCAGMYCTHLTRDNITMEALRSGAWRDK
mmetsp:Transcript_58206/g.164351  ORF Transcript_58206/g.164351 Transcript_58206/m.164351 type:complete len:182 (+) Transcript_58206:84-629(+)